VTPQTTAKETITRNHVPLRPVGLDTNSSRRTRCNQAKRFLLDSVGCALGGYQQHDVIIALEVLKELRARASDRDRTARKIDAVSASLANALMIRCMDYNDIYWKQDPSHPPIFFRPLWHVANAPKAMAKN